MNTIDKSYIAGFFDGEGSVGIFYTKASKNGKLYPKLMVRISQNDRTVLDWICDIVGYGSVHKYAERKSRPNCNVCHDYTISNEKARQFLWMVLPYLKVKHYKVLEMLTLDSELVTRKASYKIEGSHDLAL